MLSVFLRVLMHHIFVATELLWDRSIWLVVQLRVEIGLDE